MDESAFGRVGQWRLLALMLHGIEVAKHTVVVALGIADDGTKLPLGPWPRSRTRGRPLDRKC